MSGAVHPQNITQEPRFRSVVPCSQNAADVAVHETGIHGGAATIINASYRAERNAIASAIAHPTMTSEVTAPAVTLAFSFRVVGRSVSIISAGQYLALARSLAGARGRAASKPGEGWRR
jgi:hypothetical protein